MTQSSAAFLFLNYNRSISTVVFDFVTVAFPFDFALHFAAVRAVAVRKEAVTCRSIGHWGRLIVDRRQYNIWRTVDNDRSDMNRCYVDRSKVHMRVRIEISGVVIMVVVTGGSSAG